MRQLLLTGTLSQDPIGLLPELLKEKLIDVATCYADQTEAYYRAFKTSC